MSDFDNDLENEELEDSEQQSNTNDRAWVRKLEKDAKEGKAAKAEAEKLRTEAENAKKENAFLKAGIDLDSPLGKMFAKGYDGELTVDALKTAASAVGLIPTSADPQVAEEVAGLERIANASAGTNASIPTTTLDELRAVKFGDEAAVLDLLRKAGSEISFDDGMEWMESPTKYTSR